MAYNEFTLDKIEAQFGVRSDSTGYYFADAPPAEISQKLQTHLSKYVSLAIQISTERARGELIVMPVLLEVIEQFPGGAGLFSGKESRACYSAEQLLAR